MLLLPSVFILLVLSLASLRTVVFCSTIVAVGFLLPSLVEHAKEHRWCAFIDTSSTVARLGCGSEYTDVEIVDDGLSPHGSVDEEDESDGGDGEKLAWGALVR